MTITLVMTSAGPVPTSPTDLRTALVNAVAATNPGYTANLPGSLIEDITSTDVGALTTIDQARIDSVNDLTPYGANAYLLAQQGAMLGFPQNASTNTSVYVQFSGTAGYTVNAGTLVSDGSHTYQTQTAVAIPTGGTSAIVNAVATTTGSWAVPANTVTTISSYIPGSITLTVTNPNAGIPSTGTESVEDYRGRILNRLSSPAQGIATYVKSLIQNVAGVTQRLVSIQQATGGWKVIVGGGDSYEVGYAIYQGFLNLSDLVLSTTTARNVSVTLIDGNDSYTVGFINPPIQTVTITATWNTSLASFTAGSQVNELGSASIQSYINSVVVGQPINLLEMTYEFQEAIISVLDTPDLSTLTFSVYINGTLTAPTAGTSLVVGDSESYFYIAPNGVTISQG